MDVTAGGGPVLPLAVYPDPAGMPLQIMEAIKRAKSELMEREGVPFKLQVSPAVPGSPTRVLSFAGPPPFLSDTAKLRNWADPDELRYWLEWVLDEDLDVNLGFTKAMWLERYMPGVREVPWTEADQRALNDRMYDRGLPY